MFNAGESNQNSRLNAQLGTQANLTNAGYSNDAMRFTAGERNQTDRLNAQLGTQTNLANTGWANDAARFGADAANQASLFNTGQANQFKLTDAGFAQQANLANANNANQWSMFNTGEANQSGRLNAQLGTQTNLANAQMGQQANMFNAGAVNDTNQFNAGLAQQTGLANMGATNQFGLANMDAYNSANLANAQIANQSNQFNAGQYDTGLARQMQAAGLLGSNANAYAGNSVADIGAMMGAGNSLWNVQNQYNRAPLENLQAYGSLLNPNGTLNTVTGQNVVSNGTSTTTKSPSIFDMAIAAATAASGFSDRRLKRNIAKVGELDDGLGVYEFDYIWGGERARGVMADEVAELRPHALGPIVAGFATVNYEAL
jgi:hypothetical protein